MSTSERKISEYNFLVKFLSVHPCTESKATAVAKGSNSPNTKKNRKEKLRRLHQAAAKTTKEPGRSLDVCNVEIFG